MCLRENQNFSCVFSLTVCSIRPLSWSGSGPLLFLLFTPRVIANSYLCTIGILQLVVSKNIMMRPLEQRAEAKLYLWHGMMVLLKYKHRRKVSVCRSWDWYLCLGRAYIIVVDTPVAITSAVNMPGRTNRTQAWHKIRLCHWTKLLDSGINKCFMQVKHLVPYRIVIQCYRTCKFLQKHLS